MGQPETDDAFRGRLYSAVDEADRADLIVSAGAQLDAIGRRYGRFRTGVPLATFDAASGSDAEQLRPPALAVGAVVETWSWPNVERAELPRMPGAIVWADTVAFEPPPPTLAAVPYTRSRADDGHVRAFMVVGRLGLDHSLAYLFLGGDPSLEQVEALVRGWPQSFPGDTVVIDLGESYGSHAEAERRVAEMRSNMPRTVSFMLADIDE